MDLDVEPGDNAKSIRFSFLRKRQSPFFSQTLSTLPPSQVRSTGNCASVLGSQTSQGNDPSAGQRDASADAIPSQGKRQGAGEDPDICLDAFASPACYIIEANANNGQLSAADYLLMVRTSARLLGSLSAICRRLQRSSVLQSINLRIVSMAEEDDIFQDAGRNLFGKGCTKKAKEHDDELKSLAVQ